jgi:predicted metal-dependent peptidase
MILPSEMENDDYYDEESKIDVWFFLDTSGSCWDLKDRFFSAAESIPEKRFKVRLFCFDTRVEETTLESRKIYGGGGTSFKIIEQHIQNIIKKENNKYPQAIFVISDGYGDNVYPAQPAKWHWFLTAGGIKNFIHKDCNIYNLEDYE